MLEQSLSALRSALPAPVKEALKRGRSVMRGARRMAERPATRADLAQALRDAGIRPGDCVEVHSSLARIGNVEGGAEAVLGAIFDAVGEAGTVAMPVFYDTEEAIARSSAGNPIDLRTEPSQTGRITELLRRMPGAVRSSHPFASVAAVGPKAAFLCEAHERSPKLCHADSPLARMMACDGKILALGVHLGPISFYHVLEDTWEGYPLRTYALDVPVINYIDAQGRAVERPVAYLDRDVSKTRIDHDGGLWNRTYLTEHLRKAGIMREFAFGNGNALMMNCRELYDELRDLALRGITIYSTQESAGAGDRPSSVV